ncbi:MAG: patatin-like phospholipase family protein, partial [Bacilli bacterium]|nr:patatin-like phospholipase family protein [Bacilli bacterium]
MEKKAVVLSGGGSKGAYQVGVWKALRKLHYRYKIVTGTSVGALNGALMVQRDYFKCLKLWENMNFDRIFVDQFPENTGGISGKANVYKRYASSFIKNGGINTSRFEQTVYKLYSSFRFFRSSVEYGLVVYNFTTKKPLEITKKEMTEETAPLYIIASASCYPAFPMKKIGEEQYIDGGYSDNMPINLALQMGATEIVAVDLHAVGRKKKVANTNVKITMIEPKNQIASFLVFQKDLSRKAICYGYNDTMKAFHKLEGNIFTFHLGEMKKQYQKIEGPLMNLLQKRLVSQKPFVEEKLLK